MTINSIQQRNQAFMEQYLKMTQNKKTSKTGISNDILSATNLQMKVLSLNSKNFEVGTLDSAGFDYVMCDDSSFLSSAREMSDEEYEDAIKKLAQEDAQKDLEKGTGVWTNFQKNSNLQSTWKSYMQCVSPDRKSIVKGVLGQNNGKMMNLQFYDTDGQEIMNYNIVEKQWNNVMTKDELSRTNRFYEIYNQAYKDTKAAAGEVIWE
jgi:hypothetical protein